MSTDPTPATVKRLFALSGNRCAFPKCIQLLVDERSGKVLGKVCHIKGRSPGGPRHDPRQTDEERRSFDNLVLLCGPHHDVVDADEEAYSVARLLRMKQDHEGRSSRPAFDLSDGQAVQFTINIMQGNPVGGSIVTTVNQMGGQAAHQIVNVGTQPRRIEPKAAAELVSALKPEPPHNCRLDTLLGNPECIDLAQQLKSVLMEAGWTVDGVNLTVPMQVPRGLVMESNLKQDTKALRLFNRWARLAGLKPSASLVPDGRYELHIYVGANS